MLHGHLRAPQQFADWLHVLSASQVLCHLPGFERDGLYAAFRDYRLLCGLNRQLPVPMTAQGLPLVKGAMSMAAQPCKSAINPTLFFARTQRTEQSV